MNPTINSVAIASSSTTTPLDLTTFNSISASKRRHNPRKNGSRNEANSSSAAVAVAVGSKAKYSKKPDPNAPKITPPCTECGKRFWSNKALFGHMRCHPERQWRGINPPISFRRPISVSHSSPNFEESSITDEDQILADCLIMLANNSPNFIDRVSDFRFECSSCKKVFGSHQALGGHRASHKNVKGCFAIAKSDEEMEENALFRACSHERSINLEDKQLSMISRTGHERSFCVDLDLNMPAPVEDDDGSSSSYSSCLTLDLRLGL